MNDFHKGKKYYILTYGNYYEGRYIKEFDVYGNKTHTFRTKLGDLHLIGNHTYFGTRHFITERKEDALIELGVRVFKYGKFGRMPITEKKLIQYVINRKPERLI